MICAVLKSTLGYVKTVPTQRHQSARIHTYDVSKDAYALTAKLPKGSHFVMVHAHGILYGMHLCTATETSLLLGAYGPTYPTPCTQSPEPKYTYPTVAIHWE